MGEYQEKKIDFDEFKKLAKNADISKNERIGFPDSYRNGYEASIFDDIRTKLTNIEYHQGNILDIGCGCSDLPVMLMKHCSQQDQFLFLIDSEEMLNHLPNYQFVKKIPAQFPECKKFIDEFQEKFDCILIYSVLQYAFIEGSFFNFVDSALALLAPGGQLLIGDIPNISKRKRFFASQGGMEFHKNFMKTDEDPIVKFNQINPGEIDDSIILSILFRARLQGFDAYVLPQKSSLPMSNRREDILITRP